jgi:hypothetical protein
MIIIAAGKCIFKQAYYSIHLLISFIFFVSPSTALAIFSYAVGHNLIHKAVLSSKP